MSNIEEKITSKYTISGASKSTETLKGRVEDSVERFSRIFNNYNTLDVNVSRSNGMSNITMNLYAMGDHYVGKASAKDITKAYENAAYKVEQQALKSKEKNYSKKGKIEEIFQ